MKKKIKILMTSYNRRQMTLSSLSAVHAACQKTLNDYQVYLLDDASGDGTVEAISREYPSVKIFRGTGDLFWNKGMHYVFERAIVDSADYYLWLNDDVSVFKQTLLKLEESITTLEKNGTKKYILVGSTCDSSTAEHTYGGVRKSSGIRSLKFSPVQPGKNLKICDSFNGNFVLIPKSTVDILGNLDPFFTHSMGDFDYGLRAKKNAIPAYILDFYVGNCSRNIVSGGWRDTSVGMLARLKKAGSAKEIPIRDWAYFCFRHGGHAWPILTISPYVKIVLQSIANKLGMSK